MIPGLTRDEHHVYRKDGRVVPGVTRVVDMLRDFSKIPRAIREDKAELGDLVHKATSLDYRGELDEGTVDDEVRPYLTAWRTFLAEVKPEILSDEEYVYSGVYDFAGTLDHRMIIGAAEGVLDKKTGVQDLADAVQVSAYAEAAYPTRRQIMKRWALYLRPDGTYRLQNYTDHFHVFTAALTCYRFKNGRE